MSDSEELERFRRFAAWLETQRGVCLAGPGAEMCSTDWQGKPMHYSDCPAGWVDGIRGALAACLRGEAPEDEDEGDAGGGAG